MVESASRLSGQLRPEQQSRHIPKHHLPLEDQSRLHQHALRRGARALREPHHGGQPQPVAPDRHARAGRVRPEAATPAFREQRAAELDLGHTLDVPVAQPRGAGDPAGRQVTQNPEPEPEPVPMRQVALEGGHGLGGGPGAQRRRHLRVAVHPPQHREVRLDQPLGVKPAEGERGRRRLELDRVGRPEGGGRINQGTHMGIPSGHRPKSAAPRQDRRGPRVRPSSRSIQKFLSRFDLRAGICRPGRGAGAGRRAERVASNRAGWGRLDMKRSRDVRSELANWDSLHGRCQADLKRPVPV